ncbi:CaiB/BaiF CoA transferase family protein [Amycolatopsis sp. NPDC051903]|uniref:CaiB/BaiF CoA transferase family protein n=1 Tax=Amycolatopsis sp. NPDC051903 TaxID=3363936 RepID=UPI0037A5916C
MGPLSGIRVVDFSRVLAGPHCAQTLQDLGAEVIKVEPPSGDTSRKALPNDGAISGYYAQQNAGKRNVSIDLNIPGAREIALQLCERADVVVENFRPGTLDSFGLGYADVAAVNPRIIYASISGYGQHGSWRARSAYAPTVQAEAGITTVTEQQFGRPEGRQRTDSLSHADVYSGLHAALAIVAALHYRDRAGEGQFIDIAMAAVMLSINERVHVDLSDQDLGADPPVLGATDSVFFTGPGGERFVSPMSLVGSSTFPSYLAAMRRFDLAEDPRFATAEARRKNFWELHAIVQNWILTFDDLDSLDAQFDEAKISVGRVRTVNEIAVSDWAQQWSATRAVPDRCGGEFTVPGLPWHFSTATPDRSSPRLPAHRGEHNDEVLQELGYDPAAIAELRNRGAVVSYQHGGTGGHTPRA